MSNLKNGLKLFLALQCFSIRRSSPSMCRQQKKKERRKRNKTGTDCVHTIETQVLKQVHLLLIHVRIQVNLSAQVEVEEGVDAEHEQDDCCDDEEGIPESRGILLCFSFQPCGL